MLYRHMMLILAIAFAGLTLAACQPKTAPEQPSGAVEQPTGAAVEQATESPEEETAEYAEATEGAEGAMAGAATVAFTDLPEGEDVTSPAKVCLEATGVEIEPAGDGTVRPGYGHHHVLVDPSAEEVAAITSGAGAALPKDATHIHLGDGSNCKEIELTPGKHELVAVVADGAHIPLNPPVMASTIVVVR